MLKSSDGCNERFWFSWMFEALLDVVEVLMDNGEVLVLVDI